MPSNPFLFYRPSNNKKGPNAKHIEQMREAMAQSREILNSNPMPDTFSGRKTQEPFPKEKEWPGCSPPSETKFQ
jgi:hypothetical protein